jgi:hypothetical protein
MNSEIKQFLRDVLRSSVRLETPDHSFPSSRTEPESVISCLTQLPVWGWPCVDLAPG